MYDQVCDFQVEIYCTLPAPSVENIRIKFLFHQFSHLHLVSISLCMMRCQLHCEGLYL